MASILAVDDSASIRDMVSVTLRCAGYEVVAAQDGVMALELARQQRVSLVLSDVNMPNMDGIALTRELRAMNEYRFTPILLLTTESSAEYKREARRVGASGWILKPFDPDQLITTVKRVIG